MSHIQRVVGEAPSATAVHRHRVSHDLEALADALGVDDLPAVATSVGPAVWVDHAVDVTATEWLRGFARRRTSSTIRGHAQRLVGWISFLRDVRATTYWHATTDDFDQFQASMRWPDDGELGITTGWTGYVTTIKLFHEWLLTHHGVPLPFEIITKQGPRGPVQGVDYKPVTDPGVRVTPLLPAELSDLIRAAGRPTPTGRERNNRRRDMAVIAYMAATAARLQTTSLVTTYEFPELRGRGPYVTVRHAAAISKNKKGTQLNGLTSLLGHVRSYIHGDRELAAGQRRHRPRQPLTVAPDRTDRTEVHVTTPAGQSLHTKWDHFEEPDRLRLVNPDGSSPVLFLTQNGRPLQRDSIQKLVRGAATHCVAHDRAFPTDVHPHSLRHTWATFMAYAYFLGDSDLYAEGDRIVTYRREETAAGKVQADLRHTDPDTTNIYVHQMARLHEVGLGDIKTVR